MPRSLGKNKKNLHIQKRCRYYRQGWWCWLSLWMWELWRGALVSLEMSLHASISMMVSLCRFQLIPLCSAFTSVLPWCFPDQDALSPLSAYWTGSSRFRSGPPFPRSLPWSLKQTKTTPFVQNIFVCFMITLTLTVSRSVSPTGLLWGKPCLIISAGLFFILDAICNTFLDWGNTAYITMRIWIQIPRTHRSLNTVVHVFCPVFLEESRDTDRRIYTCFQASRPGELSEEWETLFQTRRNLRTNIQTCPMTSTSKLCGIHMLLLTHMNVHAYTYSFLKFSPFSTERVVELNHTRAKPQRLIRGWERVPHSPPWSVQNMFTPSFICLGDFFHCLQHSSVHTKVRIIEESCAPESAFQIILHF